MVRTRLHILDGDCAGAIRSLRSGYAMARHCAEQPTVVHALVGIALAGIMNHSAREVIQMPGAVNLYWALTALPERFVVEDITEVPVPHNPLTGQPFRYRAEERYVILDIDGGAVAHQWWIRLADR